jgi:hypothetical protein
MPPREAGVGRSLHRLAIRSRDPISNPSIISGFVTNGPGTFECPQLNEDIAAEKGTRPERGQNLMPAKLAFVLPDQVENPLADRFGRSIVHAGILADSPAIFNARGN